MRCVYCGKPATGAHQTCGAHVHVAERAWQARVQTPAALGRAMTKGPASPSLGRRGGRGH